MKGEVMGLRVENLSFSYDGRHNVLENISFSFQSGKVTGILGPNGTGKTTLLKCLNGIFTASRGKVMLDEVDLATLSRKAVARGMAYVPQYINSFFDVDVFEMILMGRLPYVTVRYAEKDREMARTVVRKMNLEGFLGKTINEMSGGERQRIFIARALVQEPKIMLLDEPTSSLDIYNQMFILNLIRTISREKDISIILTIHDINMAALFCDDIILLRDSQIFYQGETASGITEESIYSMYGVRAEVSEKDGYKHMRILRQQDYNKNGADDGKEKLDL